MTSTSVKYEREPCGRCGGSGKYSYNQIDRDRCYGCSGTGKRLTKRGKAARAYATNMLEVRAGDVPEGVQVKYERMLGTLGPEQDASYKIKIAGEWTTPKARDFIRVKNGNRIGIGVCTMVRMIPTQEQIDDINAYQDSLTKAGKVSKRVKS